MLRAQFFAFAGRGVAFFASFARTPPVSVLPIIKTCSLSDGVGLLAFNLTALAPANQTNVADSIYTKLLWPTDKTAGHADLYPPAASIVAMAADGRVERNGPLLYHALVRLPFFPSGPSSTACAGGLVTGVVCRGLNVSYVTAMLSWAVNASAFETRAAPARAFKSGTPVVGTYRTGVVLHGPPRVLRTDSVPLSDSWIVMNERPLNGGPGNGYLEGRFVDPPGGRFAFYVTGDKIFRIRKRNSYQSGMAGDVDATLSYGARGTLASWTSVAAAVYKDGSLFVVREAHEPSTTRAFAFASADSPRPRLVERKRLARENERAPTSQLLRFAGVDSDGFARASPTVVTAAFPANVLSVHVLDDFTSNRVFGYGNETDPTMPSAESPVVVFVVSEPPTFVKMHTRCAAGTRWNWEAALFNQSIATADLCRPLPAGRYSPAAGMLLDADAPLCAAGTYSKAGSTACSPMWSNNGSLSCYECPLQTSSIFPGQPCTPCPANRLTLNLGTTGDCRECPAGSYLVTNPYFSYIKSCFDCHPGEWSPAGATRCEKCPSAAKVVDVQLR
eukprot:tig00020805_g14024.t1